MLGGAVVGRRGDTDRRSGQLARSRPMDGLTAIGLIAGLLGLILSAVLGNAATVTAAPAATRTVVHTSLHRLVGGHGLDATVEQDPLALFLVHRDVTPAASNVIDRFETAFSELIPRAAPTASAVPEPPALAGPPVPAKGQATASGCGAAVAYLHAYADPGFIVECPAYSGGHQATTTCVNGMSLCSGEKLILIADACPAAYMNEASNSWVISGLSDARIDPYGSCY
jgi:hypothetical protein